MKIRLDFVTNSSSSSFIVSIKGEIPQELSKYFELVTLESINEIFRYNICSYYSESWDEDLLKYAGITEEQLALVRLADSGNLTDYKKVRESLEQGKLVYNFSMDRDVLYYKIDLQHFMDSENVTKLVNYGD